ncbi:hypothetical protein U0070_007512, partial [Myodes glareolus]
EGSEKIRKEANPVEIRRGMMLTVDDLIAKLKKKSKSVTFLEEMAQSVEPAPEIVCAHQQPLVITAQDVDGESLSTPILTRLNIGPQSKLHGLVTIRRTSLNRAITTMLDTSSDYEKGEVNKWLAERSDRTVGKGGGASDAKANEKKARVIFEEGIAPGAGCTPLQCIPALASLKPANEDPKVSTEIIKGAFKISATIIVNNNNNQRVVDS